MTLVFQLKHLLDGDASYWDGMGRLGVKEEGKNQEFTIDMLILTWMKFLLVIQVMI